MVGDQAPEESPSGSSAHYYSSGGVNVLLLHDLPECLTYRAIHDIVKPYGNVTRIHRVYDDDCPYSRCYITFATPGEASAALQAVSSFDIPDPHAEVLSSRNVGESDFDYVPNILERTAEMSSLEDRQAPTPKWFVAYYRNGRGNYIRAFHFLQQEFGFFPRRDIRTYGRGLLLRAGDLTQARMLLHFRCTSDCPFDSIRPHRTFNHCRGIVFNYDLYEFILSMSPAFVQKVWKVPGRRNMIVITCFGSSFPDYLDVGPLRLHVKPFVERPLQCFNCFAYGHGKNNCTDPPRCGRCSSWESHSTDTCEKSPYCFHCRESHQVRSRDCPRSRFEQKLLHYANTNPVSLGTARRELGHIFGSGGGARSYASAATS